ncbi:MAG: pyruvate, phosphate dikinase [Thermodesulfobacteriota bacterium]
MGKKLIYFFGDGKAEGNASDEMAEVLGNKGAQLHEMTNMGLPVPPGFTITTDVCGYYFENDGQLPEGLTEQIRANISRVEQVTGYKFGDIEQDPLLVSARSGATVSMPGMMETILNLGLTDKCVDAYIKRHGDREQPKKFILDCQRRLYEMFGGNVYGIERERFRKIFDSLKEEVGVQEDTLLTSSDLQVLVEQYKELYKENGKELPQDPFQQLHEAIKAIEESAMGEKARNYRKAEKLPEKVWTGVNIQTMVYGNENTINCCAGVGFTRDPSTGIKNRENPYGEFLLGGQGEDVVSGSRNVFPLYHMKQSIPQVYDELMKVCDILEQRAKRVQDYEFTVWRGKLYMLQTRNGKLTGRANIRSSYDMVREGLIEVRDAVLRATSENFEQLLHKMVDYEAMKRDGVQLDDVVVNRGGAGVAASPGGGVGKAVFDVKTALEYKARGERVILCRLETNPADYPGMIVAEAIATARGGKTSHAAVVARNKGIPCAVGTGVDIDEENKRITYQNNKDETVTINEGDYISVDGSTGRILNYKATLTEPSPDDPDLQDFLQLLYPIAKMRVYANANDSGEAARALQFGAEGIGLARTEYMFLEDRLEGENRALTIQSWVLDEEEAVKLEALARLEAMQRRDFLAMYRVMQARPIIIRLLDYPLHELLSDAKGHLTELSEATKLDQEHLKRKIDGYHETNPMLGHRSVRLGITHPEIYLMQVRAILSAAKEFNNSTDKKYATPHIEIPLVCLVNEVKNMERLVREVAEKLGFSRGGYSSKGGNRYRLGIMYELSGASFEADNLAQVSDFGSFGTNDLTQTTMGWSREDGSATFMPRYVAEKIVAGDPFITIDRDGPVAKAMAHAVLLARTAKPDYEFGICGEHAADPASLKVCYGVGLTNVSPAPNQVPIAWLTSAQLSLTEEYGSMLKEYAVKASASFSKFTEK